MTNDELENLLRTAKVPERTSDQWEEFPKGVMRAIRRNDTPVTADHRQLRSSFGSFWVFGLATACVFAAFVFGFWRGQQAHSKEKDIAAIQKYYREIESLFPNQLQAVVIDSKGPRFVLSDSANVARSIPLLVRICEGKQCKTVVTFSGQKIQLNDDICEVLLDSKGNVLIVGDDIAWSSAEGTSRLPVRLQARALEQL